MPIHWPSICSIDDHSGVCYTLKVDFALFQTINDLSAHSALLDTFMVLVAKYGPVVFAATLVGLWLTRRAEQQRGALLAGLSTLVALGLGQLIGLVYPRPRPYLDHTVRLLVARVHDTSFPSDHATLGFAVAVMVCQFNRKVGLGLILFALVLAFARVFVGAHYPGDVIGGALLGGGVSALAGWLCRRGRLQTALDRLMALLARTGIAVRP
ncbi:MAG: undecaprenyl-diphosphatase [Chloroflexi bacterium]|nr:undecaprenyl-diphosphatase [Chloroflexota bacterium]